MDLGKPTEWDSPLKKRCHPQQLKKIHKTVARCGQESLSLSLGAHAGLYAFVRFAD